MIEPIATLPAPAADSATLRAAERFEASFIAEMLRAAGVGEARSGLGGGAGESQFSGFLVDEYADAIARRGGLGLQEAILRALAQRGAEE